jgi:hypothetical protein
MTIEVASPGSSLAVPDSVGVGLLVAVLSCGEDQPTAGATVSGALGVLGVLGELGVLGVLGEPPPVLVSPPPVEPPPVLVSPPPVEPPPVLVSPPPVEPPIMITPPT